MAVIDFHAGPSWVLVPAGQKGAQKVVFDKDIFLEQVVFQLAISPASGSGRVVVWSDSTLRTAVVEGAWASAPSGGQDTPMLSTFPRSRLRAGVDYYIGVESGATSSLDVRSNSTLGVPHIHSGGGFNATVSTDYYRTNATGSTQNELSLSLTVSLANDPPYAPTLTYPVGETVDRGISQRFSWAFNDPDPGDSQSAYRVRYRTAGTSAWTTTAWRTSPSRHHDFPASTFAVGDLEWQAATKDARGELGPWSGSAFFAAGNPITTHSITSPANNSTVPTDTYTLTWSTPDQEAYQAQIVDGSTVLFDTGTVEAAGARSLLLDFPANNVARSLRVRVRFGGLWSSWSTVNVSVAYTPPAAPLLNISPDDAAGTLTVYTVHPEPVDPQPAVESMDVWVRESGDTTDGLRLAAGLNPSEPYTWWLPASGVEYSFRVRVFAGNGTSNWSDWVAVRALQVLDNGDGSLTILEPVFPTHDVQVTDNGDGTLSLAGQSVAYKSGTITITEAT